jgi:Zn finger protein HypA/HybF involved in hydrogenase expression
MKCPFCQQEIEPVESTGENRVEYHCPQCQSIVAAYQKGMEQILKNLVSMARFERDAK